MTTRITIDSTPTTVIVKVADDTGRDQTKTLPRYPRRGSDRYIKFVDALDLLMADPTTVGGSF